MKKLFCLILSLTMILCSVNISSFISFGTEAENEISTDEFSAQIRNMVSKYNQETGIQTLSADEESDEFETMRLIVNSEKEIDTLDAVSVISGYKDLWILQFESVSDTEEAYEYYDSLDYIESVEPDSVVTVSETSYTAKTEYLSWGPEHTGFDELNNYIIENYIELEPVTVAVIDTGVDHTHEFFNGRVVSTGFNSSDSGNANSSMDDNGHGTHVAGIIADCTPENVTIRPYKVLGSERNSGTSSTVLAGIYKAVEDKVNVINMSIGGASSPSLGKALKEADEKGIVLVGGAGNNGTNTTTYPAAFEYVIAVSSITQENELSPFSNYGTKIDLTAPGSGIYSTVPSNKFKTLSGTSMSTPFVSAAAAMAKSYHGEISTYAVKNLLYSSAIKLEGDTVDCQYFGNGLVNAMGVLQELDDSPENLILTVAPQLSVESGIYEDYVDVELTCEDKSATIYYTTDGTEPNENSAVYDGTPIHLEAYTVLSAAACAPNRRISKVTSCEYKIIEEFDETMLEIDDEGYILSCSASVREIIVPETVRGITVVGVAEGAFSNKDDDNNIFTYIKLPDTAKHIELYAFSHNKNLEQIVANGVEHIEKHAFTECRALRKISFDSVKKIDTYAFYNTGTSGSGDYSVDLPALEELGDFAFRNSSVKTVNLPRLTSLGNASFRNCTLLKSVCCSSLTAIPNTAFYKCSALTEIDFPKAREISPFAFYQCSKLETAELPECVSIGESAFYLCQHLMDVYMPKLTTMYADSFEGCNWLWELELPSLEKIEVGEYYGSIPYLKSFSAPKIISIPDYYFNFISVEYVSVPSVKSIGEYAFSGISTLKHLDISSLESVDTEYVFYETGGIDFVDAHNLKTAKSLPNNSSILVSSKLTQIECSPKNLTIYGIKGSYAESFATDNSHTFIPIPYIDNDYIPDEVSISETVAVDAIGFDLTYQWYASYDGSAESGIAIEGATDKILNISDVVYAPYYYCVVTCIENGEAYSSATKVIKNSDYTLADYSSVDKAISAVPEDLSIYTQKTVDELNEIINSIDRSYANNNQAQVDKWAEEIAQAVKNLKLKAADYSAVYAEISSVPKDLSIFKEDGVTVLQETIDRVDYSLDITQQDTVDEYAKEIAHAVENLEEECWIIRLFRAIVSFFKSLFTKIYNLFC